MPGNNLSRSETRMQKNCGEGHEVLLRQVGVRFERFAKFTPHRC